ncbi:hypothetical protein FH972_010324 [Carpinus fangiana]|uniref:Uncharacterized protein n=1 Tax=Carpinus fangiana TaxID=176857 RepID=A0A660KPV4_9ROSI|nr:hypothetical protein FH972_010324 [Carpinus fangiana]
MQLIYTYTHAFIYIYVYLFVERERKRKNKIYDLKVYMHGSQMGSKEIAVFLIFFSYYLHVFAISSPLQMALPSSDSSQESHLGEKNVPRHGSKIGHAYGHGNGGRVTGAGENANNGGSRSPNGQGGTAFIPVYAAGAANNHHQNNHHGSGNSNRNSIGVSILILVAATLASLITYLYY